MHISTSGDGRDQVPAARSSRPLRQCEGYRHRRDGDVTAFAYGVVVEYVAEGAVDEDRPRRGRLATETEYRALWFAAEVSHVVSDNLAFRRQATGGDGNTKGVKHALFHQRDKRRRKRLIFECGRMACQLERGVLAHCGSVSLCVLSRICNCCPRRTVAGLLHACSYDLFF